VVTAQLIVLFREHRLTTTGDNYGEGFTPFTITCAGHPNAKDETSKANRLNLVETGSTGITYANTVAFEKVDHGLPTDNHQCAEKLQGHSVVVGLYLGVDHRYSIAYRQHLVDLVPFMISGLRHIYRTEGNALLLVCLRILYWQQQEFFYYLDLLQKGTANPLLPEFNKLLKALHIKNHESYLPTLPKTWVTLAKPGSKRQEEGNGGGGEGAAKKVKVVTNPDVGAGLKRRFKESGHKNINVCLKVGQDAGVALNLPKIGGKEACLNWLATGFCKENCKSADTLKHAAVAVITKTHELFDQCGVPRLEQAPRACQGTPLKAKIIVGSYTPPGSAPSTASPTTTSSKSTTNQQPRAASVPRHIHHTSSEYPVASRLGGRAASVPRRRPPPLHTTTSSTEYTTPKHPPTKLSTEGTVCVLRRT